MSRNIALFADELLHMAVRLLTTTPAPLPDLARQGMFLGLFILILGLAVRYKIGTPGSLTIDSENGWGWADTIRVTVALLGLVIYYIHIDTAYSILGTVTAPLGGGDALLAAIQLPVVIDGGMVFAILSAELAIMAALIGAMRVVVLMGFLPFVVPMLTIGAVLRAPPISAICRRILRHLRWLVYAGFSAALVIQFGGVVMTVISALNPGMMSSVLAFATLNLAVFALLYTFVHGPELEQWLLHKHLSPLPAPDGQRLPDDESDSHDRIPESGDAEGKHDLPRSEETREMNPSPKNPFSTKED